MMPTSLSINWELLKQRLPSNNPHKNKPPKRRATEEEDSNLARKLMKPIISEKKDKILHEQERVRKPLRIIASFSSATATSTSLRTWGTDNDISAADLAEAYNLPSMSSLSTGSSEGANASSELDPSRTDVGRYIAIDCEMVGVGGEENERSALARVSIVNYHGHLILDSFVKPKERVTDWRTWVSGVSATNMRTAITYEEVQQKVSDILQRRILVGHAVKNDLDVLLLSHPNRDIRDTSRHPSFRKLSGGKTPGLKKLAKEILGIEIQGGEHSSIEDARACMSLYRLRKDEFEKLHAAKYPNHASKRGGGSNGKKKRNKN